MTDLNTSKKRYTLNKSERLKSRSTIETLFTLNQHLKLYPFKLVYMTEEAKQTEVKFGVSVSKRNFKTAVMRNRIKRQIREIYRTNKFILIDKISPLNISLPMMLIYVGKDPITTQEMQPKLQKLLIRLTERILKQYQ